MINLSVVAELALPRIRVFDGYAVKPLVPRAKRAIGIATNDTDQASPAVHSFIETAKAMKKGKLL